VFQKELSNHTAKDKSKRKKKYPQLIYRRCVDKKSTFLSHALIAQINVHNGPSGGFKKNSYGLFVKSLENINNFSGLVKSHNFLQNLDYIQSSQILQ
jgi:hypothetical protein